MVRVVPQEGYTGHPWLADVNVRFGIVQWRTDVSVYRQAQAVPESCVLGLRFLFTLMKENLARVLGCGGSGQTGSLLGVETEIADGPSIPLR